MSIVNKPISLILLSFLFIPCIHSAYSATGDLIKQKTSLQPILSILLKQNTPKFINGSFENYTNPTEYNSYPDIEDVNLNGWVANNTNSRLDVLVGPGYNASDGNSALRIYTTLDGATQTVSGFLPNHAYTLKFDMAATGYWNTSLNSWAGSADVGQGIDVKVDGISIGTATITSPFDTGATFGSSPFIYHAISINFIALKKELTFEFNILQNAQPTGVAIDNIMLTLIDS